MSCSLLAISLCISAWAERSVAPVAIELRAPVGVVDMYVGAAALAEEDPDYSASAGVRWRGLSLGLTVRELEGDPWQTPPAPLAAVSWRAEF